MFLKEQTKASHVSLLLQAGWLLILDATSSSGFKSRKRRKKKETSREKRQRDEGMCYPILSSFKSMRVANIQNHTLSVSFHKSERLVYQRKYADSIKKEIHQHFSSVVLFSFFAVHTYIYWETKDGKRKFST